MPFDSIVSELYVPSRTRLKLIVYDIYFCEIELRLCAQLYVCLVCFGLSLSHSILPVYEITFLFLVVYKTTITLTKHTNSTILWAFTFQNIYYTCDYRNLKIFVFGKYLLTLWVLDGWALSCSAYHSLAFWPYFLFCLVYGIFLFVLCSTAIYYVYFTFARHTHTHHPKPLPSYFMHRFIDFFRAVCCSYHSLWAR